MSKEMIKDERHKKEFGYIKLYFLVRIANKFWAMAANFVILLTGLIELLNQVRIVKLNTSLFTQNPPPDDTYFGEKAHFVCTSAMLAFALGGWR